MRHDTADAELGRRGRAHTGTGLGGGLHKVRDRHRAVLGALLDLVEGGAALVVLGLRDVLREHGGDALLQVEDVLGFTVRVEHFADGEVTALGVIEGADERLVEGGVGLVRPKLHLDHVLQGRLRLPLVGTRDLGVVAALRAVGKDRRIRRVVLPRRKEVVLVACNESLPRIQHFLRGQRLGPHARCREGALEVEHVAGNPLLLRRAGVHNGVSDKLAVAPGTEEQAVTGETLGQGLDVIRGRLCVCVDQNLHPLQFGVIGYSEVDPRVRTLRLHVSLDRLTRPDVAIHKAHHRLPVVHVDRQGARVIHCNLGL